MALTKVSYSMINGAPTSVVDYGVTGDWFAGACFGIAFFVGREHAQAQAKLGYTFKTTFQAFDVRKWSLDSQLDLLFPTIACLIILVIATLLT